MDWEGKSEIEHISSMFHRYSNSLCTYGGKWVAEKKEQEWEEWQRERERERERDFGLLSSLGEVLPIQLSANPRPWGFEQSRSLKRKNEQLLNVFLHTPHPREATRSSSDSHRQREPPLCSQHVHDCPPQDPLHTSGRIMVAVKYPWRVTDKEKGDLILIVLHLNGSVWRHFQFHSERNNTS